MESEPALVYKLSSLLVNIFNKHSSSIETYIEDLLSLSSCYLLVRGEEMAQLQRVGGQIELKCEAEKMFEVWAHKIYLVQNMCPSKVQKTVLNHGEWHKVGAVLTGNYVISKYKLILCSISIYFVSYFLCFVLLLFHNISHSYY